MLIDIHISGENIYTGSPVNWAQWLSACASCGAFYLAYRIWKNFNTKKEFVKRQLQTVFELHATIKSTTLRLTSVTKDANPDSHFVKHC
jgi:hypothetical protein